MKFCNYCNSYPYPSCMTIESGILSYSHTGKVAFSRRSLRLYRMGKPSMPVTMRTRAMVGEYKEEKSSSFRLKRHLASGVFANAPLRQKGKKVFRAQVSGATILGLVSRGGKSTPMGRRGPMSVGKNSNAVLLFLPCARGRLLYLIAERAGLLHFFHAQGEASETGVKVKGGGRDGLRLRHQGVGRGFR
jgi:hypothetical protein